ncbi:NAD-dependent epimerase/dehydratase [Streptomyces sp. SID5910]|uniref:NAD-dependent epimerase/dehydratase family protein n=1 Tax=Streptomyces sp. SID5910 TaxID=2690312 RepID=UPI001368316F|nr:NAD-dependent epimerase/dehydratase [Streptomyces sp. SID5910]MYR46539.1 NAD-dependent epimerase/dehydratase family protein [Streptomyces sp. SID5910]
MVTRPLITVLGASGLIGSSVVAELARRPVRLRAVGRRTAVPAGPGRPVADVETRSVDLSRPGLLAEAVAGSDAVIHLVAHLDGAGTWRTTDGDSAAERLTTGLVHELADALRPAPATGRPPSTVVFASTATAATGPATAYERQKSAAERVLADATAAGALRGVSLRLSTVFGPAPAPAADRGVVSAMARRALDGTPITMWHDGTVRRDLLYVRDAATAFTAALDHADALAGRHWSVGSGRSSALGDVFRTVAATVASRTGRPPVAVHRVEPPAFASAADFRDVSVDPAPFRSVTGWTPRVPLHEALDRTVAALAGTHGKDLL